VRYKHWNIQQLDPYWGYSDDQYEKVGKRGRRLKPGATPGWVPRMHAVGHQLCDLRFYAGCKRQPQQVRRHRKDDSYVLTWGHTGGAAHGIAKAIAGARRAEWRTYALEVAKVHRAGSDYEELLEPEGRTRHQALWEAW
jgi:hypothetical protein